MTIYAVMKVGGKEYRVAPGDVVRVEKLTAAPGATVEISEVCLIAIGQDVTVGSPTVAEARVIAEVIEEGHGEKIVVFKKKRRNRYQMTMDDLQSYSALRIRKIVVGKSVYAAGAPRPDVTAAATPPPSPPGISKPAGKIPERQAKNPLQPPTPFAPRAPAAVELPPLAAHDDAPVTPKVASEEPVGTSLQGLLVGPAPEAPQPSSDPVHAVHAVESPPSAPTSTETPPARLISPPSMEIAPPASALDEYAPRRRGYGIPAALVVALLVIAAGLLVWGSGQPRKPVEAAPVAATLQAAQPSVPQPAAMAPLRKEAAIKRPAAASAPSAPVQPPE
jgi:large subunit ribosomal protein L21